MKAKVQSKLNLKNRTRLEEVIPLQTPYLLYIDPSSLCNFKCRFCPSGHHDELKKAGLPRTIMKFELFKKLIDNLNDFPDPVKVLRLNKIGEPLLNKNIAEMISYAKKNSKVKYLDFATNASLLTEELSLKLIAAGTDRINLSIEGVNSRQYKEYCSVDINFEKLLNNIKFLFKNKQNCEITAKIPGNYLSEDDKENFFATFGNYCDKIFIENLVSNWPEFDVAEHSKLPISTQPQYNIGETDKTVCTDLFYSMAINADGTVSTCCSDWKQKNIIGDLKKERLIDIWKSDELKKIRILHLTDKCEQNPVCADCGHLKFCQIDNIDPYKDELLQKIIADGKKE